MSKQSQANLIVKAGVDAGLDRQTMIDEICAQTEAGPGYAATLYAAGRKAANGPVTSAKKPKGTTVSGGKMISFTNANLDLMRTEMDAALAAVSAKYGVTIETGNIRYAADRLNFKTSLEVNIGTKSNAQQAEWDRHCGSYGFTKADFGKPFVSNGQSFTISGLKPRGKKYNILAKTAAGKCYKFAATRVQSLIK